MFNQSMFKKDSSISDSSNFFFSVSRINLMNSYLCWQALGVCSHHDRSVLKKKLKEMKKREEKEQRKGERRLKEEKENTVLEKDGEGKEKAVTKDTSCSGKTIRTESLL